MLEFDTGVELNVIQHEVGFLMSVYCFYYCECGLVSG